MSADDPQLTPPTSAGGVSWGSLGERERVREREFESERERKKETEIVLE